MRVLITGINGFIGTHLKNYLLSKKYTVKGTSRTKSTDIYGGDITDISFIKRVIQDYKPDCIFHLAAQSNIPYSFEHPQETIQSNVIGTLNILETLKVQKHPCKLISAGSSAEYGSTQDSDYRFHEDDNPNPSSPYAVSKVSQGLFISSYNKAYALGALHIRPFAIIGPGKKKDAVSDFAKGIVAIERGKAKELRVGSLTHIRDFVDVRDAVVALELLITKKNTFSTVNISSGKARTLTSLVELMCAQSKSNIIVRYDKTKGRPADDRVIVGNPERLNSLGFKQKYSFEETLADVLTFWRENKNE